ncbi:NRDE family protein [Pelagicoccus albus]|uniref:NRDE family protein n=1 Tax=Pelagicoccus albus TaxID=415222 RepID=A0A7X1B537_9BACT|nr:NRDE family protein [Pelagicoccus albus]MBC2605702.1 NRDE family protein [Pelagicoccus albus]
MCTASWNIDKEGLRLFFNRDEQRTRSAAVPPRFFESEGVRYVAPIDPDGGGTWISVNEFGQVAYLLNNYSKTTEGERFKSRGELPIKLAACSQRSEALGIICSLKLTDYRPFFLGLANRESLEIFGWDGCNLESIHPDLPVITTSSFRSDEVQKYRKDRYRYWMGSAGGNSTEKQRRFHFETSDSDSAFGPMMYRPDARTQSVTWLDVSSESVVLSYQEILEEKSKLEEPIVLNCKIRKESLAR